MIIYQIFKAENKCAEKVYLYRYLIESMTTDQKTFSIVSLIIHLFLNTQDPWCPMILNVVVMQEVCRP